MILFYGDYKAEIQFDGVVQEKITGIQSESSDFKANTECEISASFQEVQYLNSRHLKIQFVSGCNSMEKTILSPEYVRLKDLKIESASIYFSNTHKNVQFKIKDLKY